MHGGSIEARSEGLGKGSEFTVRLPLREPSCRQAGTADLAPTPQLSGSRRRILVADDNPDVVESFEVMLQTLGHEVATALDGFEVLEKAERFRPDVVVLDIGMPKLNGLETARRLRQQLWGREAVLIAITGWGDEEDKRLSAEAGFNVHLVKPVDPVTLLNVLDKIDRSKANRETG